MKVKFDDLEISIEILIKIFKLMKLVPKFPMNLMAPPFTCTKISIAPSNTALHLNPNSQSNKKNHPLIVPKLPMNQMTPPFNISTFCATTYNGPGMTLAFLIKEYGMMMIGLVGNAKNGCDETGGDFAVSCGL